MTTLRTFSVFVIIVVIRATPILAFGGTVGLFASPAGVSCAIPQGPLTVPAVLHIGSNGTTGASFSAPVPHCSGLIYLLDIVNVAVLGGDTQSGILVDYGDCNETGSVFVGSIFTQMAHPTIGCCAWSITPHPSSTLGGVESVDCAGKSEPADGGCSTLSTNTGVCGCYGCTVSTRQVSWGSIKELFRAEVLR